MRALGLDDVSSFPFFRPFYTQNYNAEAQKMKPVNAALGNVFTVRNSCLASLGIYFTSDYGMF